MVQKTRQSPVCAPKVKSFMLNQNYWIKKIRDADKLILIDQEINRFNNKSLRKMKSQGFEEWLCDLKTYPETITRREFIHTLQTHSSEEVFPRKNCYDINANRITDSIKQDVLSQSNFSGIPDEINVQWGMVVKRENVRAFPTETVFAEEPGTIDFDLFQLAVLPVGSPVAILHQSKNEKWYYVQSTISKGWVKQENVALAKSRKEVLNYANSDQFLTVTGGQIETEPNPFIKSISNILFQMGDKIPLAENDEIPESIPANNTHMIQGTVLYITISKRRKDKYEHWSDWWNCWMYHRSCGRYHWHLFLY
jgi:hypothetical protein